MKKANVFAMLAIALFSALPVASRAADREVPDEARRVLHEALGAPFVAFHNKVIDELKLTDEQKKQFDQELQDRFDDAMQLFQKLDGTKPEEREKLLNEYRPKAHEKLAEFVKKTLKDDQLKRYRQLVLQQEGTLAIGQPEVGKELKITDAQRKQFMTVVEALQKKIAPLIKEANSGGHADEIRPKAMKIRKEHEEKIEALLTDDQKKQWKAMLGKPLDLGEEK